VNIPGLLQKIRDALDAAHVPYFFSGSYASSAHGVPRATNDVDVVISPDRHQLDLLLAQFPVSAFAVDRDDAIEALRLRSQFNVIHYGTLTKIDFILRQQTPFDASRFARRRVVEIAGVAVYAATPEDILLTKLWWAKLGESERQIRDAAGVLQVQQEALDFDYVERWVAVLELDHQWQLARDCAL
jgi:hypothetical protein